MKVRTSKLSLGRYKLVQIAKLIMWYNRYVFDLLYRDTSCRPRPPVHPIACAVIIYQGNGRIAKTTFRDQSICPDGEQARS